MERIAIVTGAARGIGLAITNALLRDGCTVVGVDRDEQTMARASRQHREGGASFTPKIVDLTEPNLVHLVFMRLRMNSAGWTPWSIMRARVL